VPATRLQLRTRIEGNCGGRSDKTDVINAGIDEALTDIGQAHNWFDLISQTDLVTVASVAYVTLPTGYHRILEVRHINSTSSWPIPIFPKKRIVEVYPNQVALAKGAPQIAYIEAGRINYSPIPDQVYTVRVTYYSLPTCAANDGAYPTLSTCDKSIVSYATAYLFRSIQLFQEAQYWDNRYRQGLAEDIHDDKTRPELDLIMQSVPAQPVDPVTPWLDPFCFGWGSRNSEY
jgi:hypothetical protein